MSAGFLVFRIPSLFSIVRLSKTDHPYGPPSPSEDEGEYAALNLTKGVKALLSIRISIIGLDQRFVPFERVHLLESDAVLPQIGAGLSRIPFVSIAYCRYDLIAFQLADLARDRHDPLRRTRRHHEFLLPPRRLAPGGAGGGGGAARPRRNRRRRQEHRRRRRPRPRHGEGEGIPLRRRRPARLPRRHARRHRLADRPRRLGPALPAPHPRQPPRREGRLPPRPSRPPRMGRGHDARRHAGEKSWPLA